MAGADDKCDWDNRQSRFSLRRIGQQAITVIMRNGYVRRVKVMQIMLHGVGETHLQCQHQKADRQYALVI